MASSTTTSNSSISTFTGFCAYAKAQCGDNDLTPSGYREVFIGKNSSNCYAKHLQWCPFDDPNFSTGSVVFSMRVPGLNGATTVDGNIKGAVTYTGITLPASMTTVRIRAAAKRPARVTWGSVNVVFKSSNGTQLDIYSSSSGPAIDTTASLPPATSEQYLTVSTSSTGVAIVEVSGSFEMYCVDNWVDADELFADVYVS